MFWIESHQELATHPKAKRAARILGISLPTLIGHLHLLWWWALKYAQDGELSQYDDYDIADAVAWEGDPHQFVKALIECGPGNSCGFLEQMDNGGLIIHDWLDYAGRLVEQIQTQAQKSKRNRELYKNEDLTREVRKRDGNNCRYCDKIVNWKDHKGPNGGTYDIVDSNSPVTVDNVVVSCRACSGLKQKPPGGPEGSTSQPINTVPISNSLGEQNHRVDSEQISTDNPPVNHNKPIYNLSSTHQISTNNPPGIHRNPSVIHQKSANLTIPNLTNNNDHDDDNNARKILLLSDAKESGSIDTVPIGTRAIEFAQENFDHPLKKFEQERIKQFCLEFKMRDSPTPDDIVIAGLKMCVRYGNTTLGYLEPIIENYKAKGVTTLAQVNAINDDFQKQKKEGQNGNRSQKIRKLNSARITGTDKSDKYASFYL